MAWEAQDKADAMANNSAYKAFDRTADYTNFLAILSIGRKLVTVSRALQEAGLTTSGCLGSDVGRGRCNNGQIP